MSFIYENKLVDTQQIVVETILRWRACILAKLEVAAQRRSLAPIGLPSLADQVFTTFEGAFLLARALDDPTCVQAQLAHLRHYLELLLGLPVGPQPYGSPPAPLRTRGHEAEEWHPGLDLSD